MMIKNVKLAEINIKTASVVFNIQTLKQFNRIQVLLLQEELLKNV